MKTGEAFLASVVGTVMSAIMLLARLMGMDVELELLLGTVFLRPGAVYGPVRQPHTEPVT